MTNVFVPMDPRRQAQEVMDDLPIHYTPETYRHVHFIENGQLDMDDYFSATWLQSLENFMKMDVNNIKTVEDGCFQAFRRNESAVRMTLDWLDFSVEHMSKVCVEGESLRQ